MSLERQRDGVTMQLSSNEDTVKKNFLGKNTNETMDDSRLEIDDLSLTQALIILKTEDYLCSSYNLLFNNCQQLVAAFTEDMDEYRDRDY